MVVLTNEQINTYLLHILQLTPLAAGELFMITSVLYQTGSRFEEAQRLHTWQISADQTKVSYTTAKSQNLRTISAGILPSFAIQYIQSGLTYLSYYPYSTAIDQYRRIVSGTALRTADKYLHFHAYRHNYIRRKSAEGMSLTDLTTHMAVNRQSTIQHYLSSPIFTENIYIK